MDYGMVKAAVKTNSWTNNCAVANHSTVSIGLTSSRAFWSFLGEVYRWLLWDIICCILVNLIIFGNWLTILKSLSTFLHLFIAFMESWGRQVHDCFYLKRKLAQEPLHQRVCLYAVNNMINYYSLYYNTDDHCRVKLSPVAGVAGSDYINANYLPVRVYELVDMSCTTLPHYRGTNQNRST